MPDFLLELFSEEIPARMQEAGAAALLASLLDGLGDIPHGAARAFATTRRIGLAVAGLPERQADRMVETRGPRVGSPEQAMAGFLRAAGLASADQCEIRDTGKGEFYFAVKTEKGRAIGAVLAGLVPELLDRMVWPKSMRWAGHAVRWVRPLHNILAILTGADGAVEIVPARWRLDRTGGPDDEFLEANDASFGHRFLAPDRFTVSCFSDYRSKLAERFVMLSADDRKARILADGQALAAAHGFRMKDDPGLLDEVAGLIEWPVVKMGAIKADFMALPPEVLTTSMRTHQKYFAVETADGTGLAPYFIVVGNNAPSDGGVQMIAGNERVLRARLSDAQFFWNLDRQAKLESRVEKLKERVFHAKLGTVYDKIRRMEGLVLALTNDVPGADPTDARRAVWLAKADLSSSLVGEFPELQGIMGRYLALHDGEKPTVAEAIARHYAPLGPSDQAPSAPVEIVVALADKLDTLAGFFEIGEPPTGSKDPYALRRAALGVIRIILENKLRLSLRSILHNVLSQAVGRVNPRAEAEAGNNTVDQLLTFLIDRLKVALRDRGVRHDLIEAVFALGDEDDLVRISARTRALQEFLATDDGGNLLTAYRRAARIVAIEEKKDGALYRSPVEPGQLDAAEEKLLAERLLAIEGLNAGFLATEDFGKAMAALAQLRRPLDDFFEKVTVNADRPALRANRLRLLAQIARAFDAVADFSKIEG